MEQLYLWYLIKQRVSLKNINIYVRFDRVWINIFDTSKIETATQNKTKFFFEIINSHLGVGKR